MKKDYTPYSLFFLLFLRKNYVKLPNSLLFLLFLILLYSCSKKETTVSTNEVFLSANYRNLPPEQKTIFLDSLYENISFAGNSKQLRSYLFELSTEYFYLNKQSKSLEINNKTLDLAKSVKDTTDMARANYYIGDNYEPVKKDSAYHYYLQAQKLYSLTQNNDQVARMKFNKSVLLFYQGNYIESEIELTGALKLLGNSDDLQLLFACYNLMGSNFEKLEDYPNAMRYYVLAAEILKNKNFSDTEDRQSNYYITSSVNLANIHEKIGDYKKSIAVLEGINNRGLEKSNPRIYAVILGNLGYTKMKSGNLDGVEPLLLKSLQITRELNRPSEILYKLNNLGEYYSLVGDTLQSVKYLQQALSISEATKTGEGFKNTLRLLAKMDYANAAVYKEKYIQYTDSLFKRQRHNRNKFARIEYETAKVEDQNKLLTTRNLKILAISLLSIFALTVLLILRYISSQKRERTIKKEQEKADEELALLLRKHQVQVSMTRQQEQNRISKELHDGIMNQIYGVRLHLEMLNNHDDLESKSKRLKFVDALQSIEKEVRMISHDLQKDSFQDNADYISLISDMVMNQNDIGQTIFTFDADWCVDWDEVSGLIKLNIKRIMQEAILNVNKYARASKCVITLCKNINHIILTIEDDGDGFVTKKTTHGIGHKNMRSRARSINGKITIESNVGIGTKIQLQLPLESK